MTILFKTPVRPNAASHTGTIHVAVLAFYSHVIERLVKANLQHTPKRIVSAISFDDETVEPRNVAFLVEWCYTGSLASLSKMYTPAEIAEAAAETEAEDHDDTDGDGKSEEGEGDENNISKTKGKRKGTAWKTEKARAQKRQRAAASNADTGIKIPLFAAGATIERLYCIAADLEMPEFANYCMRLIMAKYSWNFFAGKRNALDFAHRDSRVPFSLMLRDAPLAPDGVRVVVRQCAQHESGAIKGRHKNVAGLTHHLLRKYIEAIWAQRNPFHSSRHAHNARAMEQAWALALDTDQDLKEWVYRFWGDSHEPSSRQALEAAEKLLNWPSYMVEERVKVRSGKAIGHTGQAPSNPKLVRRDPEAFWQELDRLHITDVIVEECVEDSTLCSRDDDKHIEQWRQPAAKNYDNILKIVVRAAFAEKRDVSAFRFGDY